MHAKTRTPRRAWIDEGLRALASGGPAAVRVEALASRLGVSKGGFYWHFADRPDLLGEMLDAWETRLYGDVVETVDAAGGDARARLSALFGLAADRELLQVELAVRDWARRDDNVAERLRRLDERRMEFMRPLFRELADSDEDAEARSLMALALFVGPHYINVGHGSLSRADVMKAALDRLYA